MIQKSLNSLKQYLSGYFRTLSFEVPSVEIMPVDKDGSTTPADVAITLLHIEEETSLKSQTPYQIAVKNAEKASSKKYASPELCINLYVLISAHHANYETALHHISAVVEAFQAKSSFKFTTVSDCLPDAQEAALEEQTLTMSIYQMSLDQNLNMWQSIGDKLMPSVVYKVRMLKVQASEQSDAAVTLEVRSNFTQDLSRDGLPVEKRNKQ